MAGGRHHPHHHHQQPHPLIVIDMPSLATLQSLETWHLVILSLVTGTTFFHSFIGGTLQHKHLPRMQFGYLQSKIFPIYFSIQAASAGFLYLTTPVDSPLAVWVALFVGSVGNLAFVEPWTTNLMNVRHRLEKSSGTKYSDDNISPEMKSLNTKFGIAHGISSLLNLGYFIAALAQIIYIADEIR